MGEPSAVSYWSFADRSVAGALLPPATAALPAVAAAALAAAGALLAAVAMAATGPVPGRVALPLAWGTIAPRIASLAGRAGRALLGDREVGRPQERNEILVFGPL